MDKVTIVVPISRPIFLKEFFASLDALECDLEQTKLFICIDGDMRLFQKVQRFVIQSKFPKAVVYYRNKGIPSVGSIKRRRQRIADIHNEIKTKLPDSEYVLLIEDDTIVPPNTLKRLLDDYNRYPFSLFFSGIELGRWGFPILGLWLKTSQGVLSMPMSEGLKYVDAAGFYCLLTKRAYYVDHHFQPFEQILGPDVEFGFSKVSPGLPAFADYDIKCIHLTQKEPLTFENTKPIQVKYIRDMGSRFGWKQTVIM